MGHASLQLTYCMILKWQTESLTKHLITLEQSIFLCAAKANGKSFISINKTPPPTQLFFFFYKIILHPNRKAATHDDEIQRLYEEMEQQIKNEKDRILLQVKEEISHCIRLVSNLSFWEDPLALSFSLPLSLSPPCRTLNASCLGART